MDRSTEVLQNTQEFLSQLGFGSEILVQVQFDTDTNMYQILFETSKPSLLIGYHGETLSAIQRVLGYHLNKKFGEWINLSLNVNDYRERRESSVFALADSIAAKVISTGQPQSLPPMPANERRLVHLRLAEHPELTTSSEGIGNRRMVIVSLKA